MANSKFLLKYGTTKFSPCHMNSVLVEEWDSLKVSDGNIVRDRFSKIVILTLRPPVLTTNTQACAASIQLSSGAKAE